MKFHLVIDIDTGKEPMRVEDLHHLLATLTATVRDSVEREPPSSRDQVALVAPTTQRPIWGHGQIGHRMVRVGHWWAEESTLEKRNDAGAKPAEKDEGK